MIDPQEPHSVPPNAPLRVALAHDWLVGYRGGEMVLDAIASLLQSQNHTITRVYTLFDNGTPLSATLDALHRTTSPLNNYPEKMRRWLLPRYPDAVQSLTQELHDDHEQNPIDLLISTSSSAIKSLQAPTRDGRPIPHLCYCHTPARYLWSQTHNYASPDIKGRLRAFGLKKYAPKLRQWDRETASNVTRFAANSTHTQSEIKRCYDRDAEVIHPPARTDFFTPDTSIEREDHLLLVSALEPYKRVDLAIDAAISARVPLVIVGKGSHQSALRRRAGNSPLVRFAGPVSDDTLRDHYRRARAMLYPQIEDFGITAVEAQACGCPVIARRAGGALDSVIDNQTGVFFDEAQSASLADAIDRCPHPDKCAQACIENASRFSTEAFNDRFLKLFHEVTAQTVSD